MVIRKRRNAIQSANFSQKAVRVADSTDNGILNSFCACRDFALECRAIGRNVT